MGLKEQWENELHASGRPFKLDAGTRHALESLIRALEGRPVHHKHKGRADFIEQVLAERARQDAQWGGTAHDAMHTIEEWCSFIEKQLGHLHQIAIKYYSEGEAPCEAVQERLVKIAALCMAAAEVNT